MSTLRIHGDNIIECERALLLTADSFSATARWVASAPYMPRYEVRSDNETLFAVELLSGHGRWNVNLQETLQSYGAPLREATDVIVTRVLADQQHEEIILAFEFCNALPAGNNAWQRNGRAVACAVVGIPYLYFAEVGGVELGANRHIKAPRFPNPIIPFSYLTADKSFGSVCLPVYLPSPSISETLRARFLLVFGIEEGRQLIKGIMSKAAIDDPRMALTRKALTITEILAAQRQSVDTLRDKQWAKLLELETVSQKADWLEQNRMAWSKKSAGKVAVTKSFKNLIGLFQKADSLSVGAKDIPLCLIPGPARKKLALNLSKLYGDSLSPQFIQWLAADLPLVVVWITGFKPRGDDSRPDRGLVPLARMLFGDEAEVLSIVYGPAKPAMWKTLRKSPQQLARQNGLWEAIINLSDAVLVDSATDSAGIFALLLQREPRRPQEKIYLPLAAPAAAFSEHDVDSTLHLLFAHHEPLGVFEAMCNPPGGDWSGVSILNLQTREEYRWTSLPRVSGANGKRPDHVIQFLLDDGRTVLLAIESKNRAADLERGVGRRLKTYTRQLVKTPPTVSKPANADWSLWESRNRPLTDFSVVSGGAFCWVGQEELKDSLARGQLDIAFAVEFKLSEQAVLLHIQARAAGRPLLPKLGELARQFGGRLKIQVH